MNSPHTFPDPFPATLQTALERVRSTHASDVQKFRLSFLPGGAIGEEPNVSRFVMVLCGIADPDARELADAVRRLEFAVERESHLDVSLMLSNPSVTSNGHHN